MKLSERLILLFLVLGLAAGVQVWLLVQIQAADAPTPGELVSPLAELPLRLGDWHGQELKVTDEQLLYGDAQTSRAYRHASTGQVVRLWVVYDKAGEDRGHHPEVCMAVAAQPEIASGRGETALAGGTVPAQRYYFGRSGERQWVYYWYYSLPTTQTQLDPVQDAYYRLRTRQASTTLEVFAPENSQRTAELAEDFVRHVDAAFQKHLPKGAERGSKRLPVTIVEE